MSVMDEAKKTAWRQCMVILKDVGTISSVVVILSGIFWYFAKARLLPFLELPAKVGNVELELSHLRIELTDNIDPRLLDFLGHGIIIDGGDAVEPGTYLTIAYLLRRNASCEADILVNYINLNTGTITAHETFRAIKAPVTEGYIFFKLRIRVPLDLPAGLYSYKPVIVPINCGVYKEFTIPMSDPIRVRDGGEGPI